MPKRAIVGSVAAIAVLVCVLWLAFPSAAASAAEPRWIWAGQPAEGDAFLRKVVTLPAKPLTAQAFVTCDDAFVLFVNGERVCESVQWERPRVLDLAPELKEGDNVLALWCRNRGGSGGLLFRMDLAYPDGRSESVVSDNTWEARRPAAEELSVDWSGDGADWVAATEIAEYGAAPWGPVWDRTWPVHRLKVERFLQQGSLDWREPGHPEFSAFVGTYQRPEYPALFRDFVRLDRKTGLLGNAQGVLRPFATIYDQPAPPEAPDDNWRLAVLDFDYDLVLRDFAEMKKAGINVYLRFFSWQELLDQQGRWRKCQQQPKGAGLPHFDYNYQVYDYFLDLAQANGLYVVIEPSFHWHTNRDLIPLDLTGKTLLYDQLWEAEVRAYQKILHRWSRRPVIAAILVGEEEIRIDADQHDPDDPVTQAKFRAFLAREYGSLERLKQAWRRGYDYADASLWKEREWGGRKVFWPDYPLKEGVYDSLSSFEQVSPPPWASMREPEPPHFAVPGIAPYQETVPKDPVWIDYLLFKQELLISRMNDWADRIRQADPNHLQFYSNPYDFNPAWHFLHCYDRARLRFDLVGVGQHDYGFDYAQLPHWARAREYIQNVASYGPYTGAKGAYPGGNAAGEGTGGTTPAETRRYFAQWMTDLVGGGAALICSYDWNHLSGQSKHWPQQYDREVLDWFGDFTTASARVPFSLRRDAQVLVLRNTNASLSMSAGYDFANAQNLAAALYQLHVPFDILPDQDVSLGPADYKVDLDKYRFIFAPDQPILLRPETYRMLRRWLEADRAKGPRGLCLGPFRLESPHFQPLSWAQAPPDFLRLWPEALAPSEHPLQGAALFTAPALGGARWPSRVTLTFPRDGTLGQFPPGGEGEAALLTKEGGEPVMVRREVNGNPVYLVGFYLGMGFNYLWGWGQDQVPFDTLARLYAPMLRSAGVWPAFHAPRNIGVYVSDDKSLILVKERFGRATKRLLRGAHLDGGLYLDATTSLRPDRRADLATDLGPLETIHLQRCGRMSAAPGIQASVTCRRGEEGRVRLWVTGTGIVQIFLDAGSARAAQLAVQGQPPRRLYVENGRFDFALPAGPRALAVEITPAPFTLP